MTHPIERVDLEAVKEARRKAAPWIARTPLLPFNAEGPCRIDLKLENLQPIGSFKLRGAGHALALLESHQLADGVYTASAGNMAQGVAYTAREMGLPCTVIVPVTAPETKCQAVERLGGRIVKVPFDEWWKVLVEHHHPDMKGVFVHPVSDARVIAGNGVIGLEILEDCPDVDAVLVPFGGGGLSCGIAAALAETHPQVPVFAVEVETAAPLRASLDAGRPMAIEYRPSFVDGIGGKSVLEEIWPLARRLIKDSLVVSLSQTARALRLMVERNHVIAEGAGAAPVAAALAGLAGRGHVVCVVSGGNIDTTKLCRILSGWEG